MELTLDAVLNHVSDQHPWFEAARAGDPRWREWFTFLDDGRYLCWQGHGHLPELRLDHPAVQARLFRDTDSLVQHWLALGVDHWRFDVAQDLGLAVARELVAAVRPRFPQARLLGELVGFPGDWLADPAGFDGMMNYWTRTVVLGWLRGEIGARQAHAALRDTLQRCGLAGLLRSWNMLSSHDTPRLVTALGSPARARLAQLLQFTLPGIPLVYYGEELGLEGAADPGCRATMPWDRGGRGARRAGLDASA